MWRDVSVREKKTGKVCSIAGGTPRGNSHTEPPQWEWGARDQSRGSPRFSLVGNTQVYDDVTNKDYTQCVFTGSTMSV